MRWCAGHMLVLMVGEGERVEEGQTLGSGLATSFQAYWSPEAVTKLQYWGRDLSVGSLV